VDGWRVVEIRVSTIWWRNRRHIIWYFQRHFGEFGTNPMAQSARTNDKDMA
jgi:hypothetical protein